MLNGNIMIVSDRPEVLGELESIIGAGDHLSLAVPDGDEALRMLRDAMVPDLVISDLGSEHSLEGIDYVWRFREMNRLGRHMVIVEDGAPFSRAPGEAERGAEVFTPLRRPFRLTEVRDTIDTAMRRVERDIGSLRGEMWREVDRLQRAVRDVQQETVTALAATIAARDPYMHGHGIRVAALCVRVGRLLRLGEKDLGTLEDAAVLHEIGKGSVPVELLHKTEPLSAAELERIRAHARTGAEIVRQVPSLRRVAPLIEHQGTDHRELGRYLDAGSVDFLLAGILRVVDAYDAMTHPRSYRGALPRDYWEPFLEQGAGHSLNPSAVRALLKAVRRDQAEAPPLAA
jgi:response regulator RpfG family c-di-GMP phosphodiesterase